MSRPFPRARSAELIDPRKSRARSRTKSCPLRRPKRRGGFQEQADQNENLDLRQIKERTAGRVRGRHRDKVQKTKSKSSTETDDPKERVVEGVLFISHQNIQCGWPSRPGNRHRPSIKIEPCLKVTNGGRVILSCWPPSDAVFAQAPQKAGEGHKSKENFPISLTDTQAAGITTLASSISQPGGSWPAASLQLSIGIRQRHECETAKKRAHGPVTQPTNQAYREPSVSRPRARRDRDACASLPLLLLCSHSSPISAIILALRSRLLLSFPLGSSPVEEARSQDRCSRVPLTVFKFTVARIMFPALGRARDAVEGIGIVSSSNYQPPSFSCHLEERCISVLWVYLSRFPFLLAPFVKPPVLNPGDRGEPAKL